MNDILIAVCGVNLLASLTALVVALRKRRGLSLTEIALRAISYTTERGTAQADFINIALHAAQRLDASDNGKRDFTDAQLRIAIDAELHKHP